MNDTKLLEAINDKDIERVKILLESGEYFPNRDDSSRNPPLLECLSADGDDDYDDEEEDDAIKCEMLKVLVRHGADVNVRTEPEEFCDLVMPNKTAAMFAAERGYLQCLVVLHESGADLNASCPFGETALFFAVRHKQVCCVQYLAGRMSCDALNSQDEDGMTALMWAASLPKEQGLACMKCIIEAGADLNLENLQGRTALLISLRYQFVDAVNILLDKGAIFSTVTWDGFTPLSAAFTSILVSSNCIVRLLEMGGDPTVSRRDLLNVHRAVGWGQTDLVRALVMNGHPPMVLQCVSLLDFYYIREHGNPCKISPLAMAFLCKRPDVVKYFIANRFFTSFDSLGLQQNTFIRKSLQKANSNFEYDHSKLKEAERKECLEIFDFMSSTPLSLLNLCLAVVSSALCQSLLCEDKILPCDEAKEKTSSGCPNPWICRPSYREKVACLNVPTIFKKTLLFQTPTSRKCCQSWGEISLTRQLKITQCPESDNVCTDRTILRVSPSL